MLDAKEAAPQQKSQADIDAEKEFQEQMLLDAMDDPEFRSMRARGLA